MHGRIPDEIVLRILYYVPPEENLGSFQCLSKRLYRLANEPLLWRYHCRTGFKYWDSEHDFRTKLTLRVLEVDWKRLWILRRSRNARVSRLLDGILVSKVGRLKKYEKICLLGYDAKDYLLQQCRTDESADDVLARRYHASAALGSIHRGIAVKEWAKFQSPHTDPPQLDRALAGFDMFVLHDQKGDIDDVQALLHKYSRQFLAAHPSFGELSTRRKALALLRWVRSRNLTGMDEPMLNYRNVRNCLIGHALLDNDHPSLPLISSAIYCCLAEKIGLHAKCCAFPAHVHATVFAPSDETLDGTPLAEPPADLEMMYLNPYDSEHEVHVEELRMKLDEFGWDHGREAFLRASPTSVLVTRTAHNIRASYVRFQHTAENEAAKFMFRSGDPFLNMESLLYAVLWVNLLLTPTAHQVWDSSLEHFLNRFRKFFAEDAWLVRKYLAPLYDKFVALTGGRPHGAPRAAWEDVHLTLQLEDDLDMREPTVRRRDTPATRQGVRYRVGQVFVHRRYGTLAAITGWSVEGTSALPRPHILPIEEAQGLGAGEDMEVADGTRSPPPVGWKQTYYTSMRYDVDRLVVAEDNIQIITDPDQVPQALIRAAGKFFKRFDRETCSFVSNVKELFPDD